MKNIEKLFLYCSDTENSQSFLPKLKKRLLSAGFSYSEDFTKDCDMALVIGGDGTFLRFLRDKNFPNIPIAGINTGHLGFFMEYSPNELDSFVLDLKEKNYSIHRQKPLLVQIKETNGEVLCVKAINDAVIKKNASSVVHLNLSIGSSFIEKFSGDGLLVSTPAGSTSYNYSVNGGIIDPRVSVLQVTPIAPMNTTAYRSFTSGIILPADLQVHIELECRGSSGLIIIDGAEYYCKELESVDISLLLEDILLVRKPNYDYWAWVARKFI